MSKAERSIELAVEVAGTPEEVWRAIATGPGISSWYVPHEVEEREGGTAIAKFGDAPEMQVPGRVVVWDPPRRIVFDGGDGGGAMAFEWLVEARGTATCIVRLVHSGFGDGEGWEDEYDAMTEGWQLFLLNLQLHCRYHLGQEAVAMLPSAQTPDARPEVWTELCDGLGLAVAPEVGDRIVVDAGERLGLAGTVVKSTPSSVAVILEEPVPGTAFLAVEGCAVSIWAYLYGNNAQVIVDRDKPRWQAWLDAFVEGL